MATPGNVDARGWTRQSSSPFLDGSYPLTSRPSARAYPPAYAPSATARIIYVDATLGNDGTGSPTNLASEPDPFNPSGSISPYATISAGYAQMRTGEGDWILLKRGETWTESGGGIPAGKSSIEPSFMGCYGSSGARPIIQTGTSNFVNYASGTNHVTFYGIDLYSHERDPDNVSFTSGNESISNSGIRIIGTGSNIIIDDCIFSFYAGGLTIQGTSADDIDTVTIKNCLVKNSYQDRLNGHASGIFANNVIRMTIVDNVFYQNGWNDDATLSGCFRTQFSHNVYLQSSNDGKTSKFNRNISIEGSSHGVQVRHGGEAIDNFIARCAVGMAIGSTSGGPMDADANPQIHNNVILEGERMDNTDPQNPSTTTAVYGMTFDPNGYTNGASGDANNNLIANRRESGTNVGISTAVVPVTKVDNVVYAWNASEDITITTEPNPTAVTSDYMVHTGDGTTYADFVTRVTSRGLGVEDVNYTAPIINDWFRSNFNMSEYV